MPLFQSQIADVWLPLIIYYRYRDHRENLNITLDKLAVAENGSIFSEVQKKRNQRVVIRRLRQHNWKYWEPLAPLMAIRQ